MRKLLLTGANGFLGKCIVQSLNNKFKISTLSRKLADYEVLLDRSVPSFIYKFDLVIHAAGKAHTVPKKDIEKKMFFDINVKGTQNLLDALEIVGVPSEFVFISSIAVYGRESGININENHSLAAKDPYGLSKIKAERLVKDWCKKHNVICTILRLPLIVGKNPPGNLASMIKAIRKGYYFNIGGGTAKKSMVLANDVAAFIPSVALVGGIYNLTDGYHPSFYELSCAFAMQMNKKKPYNMPLRIAKLLGYIGNYLGSKAPINHHKIKKITSDLTFDDEKAVKTVAWKPQTVLDFLNNNNF